MAMLVVAELEICFGVRGQRVFDKLSVAIGAQIIVAPLECRLANFFVISILHLIKNALKFNQMIAVIIHLWFVRIKRGLNLDSY